MPELSNRAKKDLQQLPAALQQLALTLIAQLATEPALGKKLQGKLAGQRSLRLAYTHRIIYLTDPVYILTISPRKDAYRLL
jgi:mRNA-degrading endonuclease RelE of RelBE toxin-antitoxin system